MKGKDCSSGWSAAQQTTQEGSVAAHRQPHHMPLHSAMDFSSLVLLNRPPPLTTAQWSPSLWAQHENEISLSLPPSAPSSSLSLAGGLGCLPAALAGEMTWCGTAEQTDSRPALGGDALYRHVVLEVLALSFKSYLSQISKEPRSRKSSWCRFSSFFSAVIKTSAAGRAGHMADICSA